MENGNKTLVNQMKSLTKQLPNKKKILQKNLNHVAINVKPAENEIIPTID